MDALTIIIIAYAVLLGGILIYFIIKPPVFTVPEQKAVIIERFGRFRRVAGSGLHFMMPFIDQKRKFVDNGKLVDYVDLRERTVNLSAQIVTTKDNVQIQIESIAYYEITHPAKAFYGIDDVIVAINQFIITVLRSVIADMPLEALRSERDDINQMVQYLVERARSDWGITIRSVELKELKTVTPDII